MRITVVAGVLVLMAAFLHSNVVAEEKGISLPPESLAQWYKPANKRQVWLHTMFNLRREMQAVAEYSAMGEKALMEKWSGRLIEHYRKIAEMVPEWEDELDFEALGELEQAVQAGDFEAVGLAQRKLGRSCNSCHREFRPTVAILYRSPEFKGIMVTQKDSGKELDYADTMNELVTLINRLKVSMDDGRNETALESLKSLQVRLDELGETCVACHKEPEPKERFHGKRTNEALQGVEQGLKKGDLKLAARSLGAAAVYNCARCHSVHRFSTDMRGLISLDH
jgi:hypothetical protein